jgi:hypothetical protein
LVTQRLRNFHRPVSPETEFACVVGGEPQVCVRIRGAVATGLIVGRSDTSKWPAVGRLQSREHLVKGIETFPETLLMLFDGRNEGKLVIEV